MNSAQWGDHLDSCDLERRADGAVLVRVHSCDRLGRVLPDAVFSFRVGDPQFDYWDRQLKVRGNPPNREPRK